MTKTAWRKSSYSGHDTDCLEIALRRSGVAIRDSKDRDRGHLDVGSQTWANLTTSIRRG